MQGCPVRSREITVSFTFKKFDPSETRVFASTYLKLMPKGSIRLRTQRDGLGVGTDRATSLAVGLL